MTRPISFAAPALSLPFLLSAGGTYEVGDSRSARSPLNSSVLSVTVYLT